MGVRVSSEGDDWRLGFPAGNRKKATEPIHPPRITLRIVRPLGLGYLVGETNVSVLSSRGNIRYCAIAVQNKNGNRTRGT